MKKVKITADAVLNIISGIFNDEDVNTVITDATAPEEWRNKRITEALNVEYFTFKHRPISTAEIIADKMREATEYNRLAGLGRSFCAVSLGGVERVFSKDVDTAVVAATMEYWVQTDKIKLLEFLIEDSNIATSGIRIPVVFGDERRRAVVIFSAINVTDIQPETIFGEMAVCEITVNMLLYPDVVSYSDYEVEFRFKNESNKDVASIVPLSSFSYVTAMTQKPVPQISNTENVGSLNLSCARSFVLVFDGYNNEFINYITERALRITDADNNQDFTLTVTRGNMKYTHNVVIKDHQVTVNADTGNETHTLSLVTRGMK